MATWFEQPKQHVDGNQLNAENINVYTMSRDLTFLAQVNTIFASGFRHSDSQGAGTASASNPNPGSPGMGHHGHHHHEHHQPSYGCHDTSRLSS